MRRKKRLQSVVNRPNARAARAPSVERFCDKCGDPVGRGDDVVECPQCGVPCCTTRCIAGRNVMCFQCEEKGE